MVVGVKSTAGNQLGWCLKIYSGYLIDAVLSSLYYILYQVYAKSVLGQILLSTCLSFRRLSALGKWGLRGLPQTQLYPYPSPQQVLLSSAWQEVSIPFPKAEGTAVPEALQLFGLSAYAQFMHGFFAVVAAHQVDLGLSPRALLPMSPFLDLCLPVCELLSSLAGVQPHTACSVSQSQPLQSQGFVVPILPGGWHQAGPPIPYPRHGQHF